MPRITIRLNDKQYTQLQSFMKQNGCDTISNYVRLLLLEKDKHQPQKILPTSETNHRVEKLVEENLRLTRFIVLTENHRVNDDERKQIVQSVKQER